MFMIRFGPDICGNLELALSREWLETNGLGGFASSTIIGLNTRRYHGLLTAATKPPIGRFVLLSKLEETLVLEGRRYDLAANRYPGVVHPQGYQYLKGFRLDPFPVFTYAVEGIEIEKTLFLPHGENTVVVQYELRGAAPDAILEVWPLIAFRDYHSTSHENGSLNREVRREEGLATIAPYQGLPELRFAHDAGALDPSGDWYRNFEYDIERERGLDFQEDLYSPFVLHFDLGRKASATIIASTERHQAVDAAVLRRAEIERRRAILAAAPYEDEFLEALVAAADQFIVARGDQKTVIAGYHWFSDWGRDTMIALPGLTLLTGRTEVARSILLEFAKHVDQGMLPNRFPDAGEAPEYNTVDATLWFFEAVRSLLGYTGDYDFVHDNLYPALQDIIEWHVRGTRYGIRLDSDGLLAAGEPGVQLTWMDAKVGDWVVTPRHGKPVEIQALWYNALRIMEGLASHFGDAPAARRYAELAARASASFHAQFWNESAGCLYDVVSGAERDGAIRPNQVFAVSLPHTMLDSERSRRVLEVVERELLTPCGLRSLAPGDPQYRARYEGGPWSRDGAYHQGTVWPWLLGPFLTACRRVHGRTEETQSRALACLAGMREHLREAGLGQISEIFDGSAPHRPAGCMAQAWSVAEILRACVEDVYAVEPPPAGREAADARPASRQSTAAAS
jgi:predicted glycogen debranching enzyme